MPIDQNDLTRARNTLSNVQFGSGSSFGVDPRYVDRLVAPDAGGQQVMDRATQSGQRMETDIAAGRQQIERQGAASGQRAYDDAFQTTLSTRRVATDAINDTERMNETYETARRAQFRSSAARVRGAFLFSGAQQRALGDELAGMIDGETARQQQQAKMRQLGGILPALLGEGFSRDMSVLGDYQSGRQFRDPIGRDLADSMALLGLAESGRAAGVDDAVRRIWG